MHSTKSTTAASAPADFLPLPHLAFHVLVALGDAERHGWAVVRRIEELTSGMWSPSAGSLYLSMTRLEQSGLIEDAPAPADETDARRRYYRLTPLGRSVLELELRRVASLLAAARAP
jgi:DNA-binding PadR family transcriptional regulator